MKGPGHVGIIMDGNRRFSRRLMEQPWKGHEWGRKKLEEVLSWCLEAGVQELTVYAFSMQNFHRPPQEFAFLMRLAQEFAERIVEEADEVREKGIRVRFIGRTFLLPPEVREAIARVEAVTAENGPYRLNVAFAYGGREELEDAVRSIASKVASGALSPDDISSAVIQEHLWLSSEPDLVIRTGGDRRTSNFLPWQTTYSEWFFVDELWPEFSRETFFRCLEEFATRERRFGR